MPPDRSKQQEPDPPPADEHRKQLKLEVMEAYGGAACSWPDCDNMNLDELQLHHTAGGGNQHRREIGISSGGYSFYLWLRNEGYPSGYAVLYPTHHKRLDNQLRAEREAQKARDVEATSPATPAPTRRRGPNRRSKGAS
jgi:hypothetical protein